VSDHVFAEPCCICRGADGTLYWATWCPHCEERDVQTAIAGSQRAQTAECSVCGTRVEVDFVMDGPA